MQKFLSPPVQKDAPCVTLQREEKAILGYDSWKFGVPKHLQHLGTVLNSAWGTEELLVCRTCWGHGASH